MAYEQLKATGIQRSEDRADLGFTEILREYLQRSSRPWKLLEENRHLSKPRVINYLLHLELSPPTPNTHICFFNIRNLGSSDKFMAEHYYPDL
jgi:hypothetical protein